jgi:hypothetical protein
LSYRHKPTEFEVQQTVLLGAQISAAHEEFKEWAMMEPDEAFILWLLEHPDASLVDMLKVHAKLEFLKSTTEVTKLAMIVGSEEDITDLTKETQRNNPTQ